MKANLIGHENNPALQMLPHSSPESDVLEIFLKKHFLVRPYEEYLGSSLSSSHLCSFPQSRPISRIVLQIPEATPTTVRAVVSTVNSGASKPHLVITETLSTIDFEVIMVVLVVVIIVVVDF